jgi:Mpv17 / PMP22 family
LWNEKERKKEGESCFWSHSTTPTTHTHSGPLGHAWYKWLDTFVSARLARGTVAFVASKVVLDEIFFGPIHVAGYFGGVTLAEGGTLADAVDKIKADFVSAYTAELAFWPAFQAANFWKVPVRHQLLAVNAACLLDATFLCWVSANEDWVGKAKGAVGWKWEMERESCVFLRVSVFLVPWPTLVVKFPAPFIFFFCWRRRRKGPTTLEKKGRVALSGFKENEKKKGRGLKQTHTSNRRHTHKRAKRRRHKARGPPLRVV